MTARSTTRAARLAAVLLLIALVTGFHHSIGLTNPTTAALSLLLVVLADLLSRFLRGRLA